LLCTVGTARVLLLLALFGKGGGILLLLVVPFSSEDRGTVMEIALPLFSEGGGMVVPPTPLAKAIGNARARCLHYSQKDRRRSL